jgi:hypothetical protein
VASQVHLGSFQASGYQMPAEFQPEQESFAERAYVCAADSDVTAHGMEFVALPGQSESLRKKIPLAMRSANGSSQDYVGCMVLFSEKEARLVSVITLWKGRDRATKCNQDSKRLKKLLEPYVDRWLRTRRFVTFL